MSGEVPPQPFPADPFPARPILAPGVLVTRRDDGHLQVGLAPELQVRAPDNSENRELLQALSTGQEPGLGSWPVTPELAAVLVGRGLVVDGAALLHDLPPSGPAAHAVACVYTRFGRDAPRVLARRRRRPVRCELGGPLGDSAELVSRLLASSSVPDAGAPYAVLVATTGELDRRRADRLVRDQQPHLVLRVVEGIVELGPFVVPGVTACLRCVDAGLGEGDPRRALVVEQYSRSGALRADGIPEPLDPAVVTAALAWAVRDLVSFVDDEVPTTWSTLIRLGPGMTQQRTEISRHSGCGCAWAGADLATP